MAGQGGLRSPGLEGVRAATLEATNLYPEAQVSLPVLHLSAMVGNHGEGRGEHFKLIEWEVLWQ